MTTPLEKCFREEQCYVIRVLWSEGNREINRRMIQQYCGSCMSERKVYHWVERFQEGRISVIHEHRSGHPCTAVSDANIAHVDALIGENRPISVDTVATMLNICIGSANGIIHEAQISLCSRWVMRQLTDEHKLKCVQKCKAFLTHYHAKGVEFLVRIVTGDETFHYYEPESKTQSMEWRHTSSPAKKKFKSAPSAEKLMLTLFWDMNGPILEHYQAKGETVNSARYSSMPEEKLKLQFTVVTDFCPKAFCPSP
jgi:hypothetical protein